MKQQTIILFLFFLSAVTFGQEITNTIFHTIPRTDIEFQNIFGRSANATDAKLFNLSIPDYLKDNARVIEGKSLKDLEKAITEQIELKKSGKGGYITIIGHNENGILKFPDGKSEIHLAEIEKKLDNLRGIFISCKSEEAIGEKCSIGLNFKLSFQEALDLATPITKEANSCCLNLLSTKEKNNRRIKDIIEDFGFKKNRRSAVVIAGAAGLTGGLIIVNMEEEQLEDNDEKENTSEE